MNVFALDIGGTETKTALITSDRQLLSKSRFPTPLNSLDGLLRLIALGLDSSPRPPQAIAVSCPCTVQRDGRLHQGGGIPCLNHTPLAALLQERFQLPAAVENDGKCALLGEFTWGALQGVAVGAMLTLGTGVGGGILIDGQVLQGAHRSAGEFSRLLVRPGLSERRQNQYGLLCSHMGLSRRVREAKGLPENAPMDGYTVFRLVEQGDLAAIAGLHRYARDVASLVHNLQSILDPDRIAIGGGISSQPALLAAIREELDLIHSSFTSSPPKPVVVAAQFGNDANLLGAVSNLFALHPYLFSQRK